jgi:ATP-dependent helicase HepA
VGFLKETIISDSNIDWFKEQYPEELWNEIVTNARKIAKEKALAQFKKRSNIRGAREEMERTLSARVANCEYYGIQDDTLDSLKEEQACILEALKHPRIVLDSVAYIWMEEQNE